MFPLGQGGIIDVTHIDNGVYKAVFPLAFPVTGKAFGIPYGSYVATSARNVVSNSYSDINGTQNSGRNVSSAWFNVLNDSGSVNMTALYWFAIGW